MNWQSVIGLPVGPKRTAAIVAWVQALFPADRRPPLVGGAAVELLTGGAYTTGDIDLVGEPDETVAAALTEAGFEKEGRHWIHEAAQVFLEFPSAQLDAGEETGELRMHHLRLLLLRVEDLIAGRLAQWMHWRSPREGINAYLLAEAQRATLDHRRLRMRARALEARPACDRLETLLEKAAREPVSAKDLEAWASEVPSR